MFKKNDHVALSLSLPLACLFYTLKHSHIQLTHLHKHTQLHKDTTGNIKQQKLNKPAVTWLNFFSANNQLNNWSNLREKILTPVLTTSSHSNNKLKFMVGFE